MPPQSAQSQSPALALALLIELVNATGLKEQGNSQSGHGRKDSPTLSFII